MNQSRIRRAFLAGGGLVAVALAGTGCAGAFFNAPVAPPQGFIYSNVKAPLTTDYHQTPTGDSLATNKRKTFYIREPIITGFSFGWDDVSVERIAREGNIKEVAYAEWESFSVLGVFGKYTVQVYGK